ncbi:MAG: hypothetical protein ACYS8Z_21425 [Planctomycetota bacterium]|jgi:uncharacterized membrane protein YfcA
MRKAVKYPIVVFLAAMLVSVAGPHLLTEIDPHNLGRFVGRVTVFVVIAAIVVGWAADRRHR